MGHGSRFSGKTRSLASLLWTAAALAALGCNAGLDPTAAACPGPEEDCACAQEGQEIPCYGDAEFADGNMVCHVGRRVCAGGAWTACLDMETEVREVSSALIEGPAECNPCNPNCQVNRDRPNDADLNPGNSTDVAFDPSTGGIRPRPNTTTTMTGGTGPTNGEAWDLAAGDAEGLTIDPSDGALILDSSAYDPDFIWIANTGDGTISKFNIYTGDEEGRYYPGPRGTGNDPSRTSINTTGDAFVAGRNGIFVSRISASGHRGGCPDTNGDGVITTSQDLNGDGVISTNLADGELLPFGSDDCLLWYRDLRDIFPHGKVRAVAAQDLIDPLAGTVDEYVWVGGCYDGKIAQLDARTGGTLVTANTGRCTYGFALDRDQNLWISTISRTLQRVDTTRCNGAVGCPGSWCNGDTAACEAAIKQNITLPRTSYGITVDFNQRVWLGGYGDAMVYDRSRSYGSRARNLNTGGPGGWRAGITADAQGNVWTTGSDGVWRIDGNNTSNRIFISRTAASTYARGWGAAVDSQNQAWIINRWNNRAHVFVPAGPPSTGLTAYVPRVEATSVRSPYTYSDMTGSQLRLAAANRGTYYATLEGCTTGMPQWEELDFNVTTPPGTFVLFRVRVANTLIDLASAGWAAVGVIPSDTSPLDARSRLLLAGESPLGRYAQIELTLISTVGDPTMVVTPRVYGFGMTHTCIETTVGRYSRMYDATVNCDIPGADRPVWKTFDWFTTVPDTTSIAFEIRTGPDPATTSASSPAILTIPSYPENGGLPDLGAFLGSNGLPTNEPYLEVTAVLNSSVTDRPTLIGFDTVYECVPME